MSADLDIILPARLPEGRSWLRRLARSNGFTITLSVLLHGVVFLAFYRVAFHEEGPPRRLIIPEARLAPMGSPGGGPGPGQSGQMPKLSSPPPAAPPGGGKPAGMERTIGGSSPLLAEMPVVAVNLTSGSNVVVGSEEGKRGNSAGLGLDGSGGGSLMGTGYGGGGGGGGGPVGPATSFFGATGNAYRVVYVVDVSNSLMYYRRDIIRQATSSIHGLVPTQELNIILAKPRGIAEFRAQRLVYATGGNKTEAIAFLEATAPVREVGAADPMAGLDRAFSMKPELIYFLTDGEYDKVKDDLLKKVRELFAAYPAKITVISIEPSPRNVPLLQAIAQATGGNLHCVELKAGE